MRPLPLLLVLALPAPAAADNFVEVLGGIMIPVEDDDWTNYVESGPKLATRLGSSGSGNVGGMLSVDWTPLNTDDMGFGNAVEISAHRFRILGGVTTQHALAMNMFATLRVGAGIDIGHVNVKTNLGPLSGESSDTDSGIAVEAGFGLWFRAGSMLIGGEVAAPLAFHGDSSEDEVDLADYSSFDIDLLFGVRFVSQ